MKQCVQIMLSIALRQAMLKKYIQESAQQSGIEGMAFIRDPDNIKIVANGASAAIDEFIDLLYIGSGKLRPETVTVEPFPQSKDFRGVFRVIE